LAVKRGKKNTEVGKTNVGGRKKKKKVTEKKKVDNHFPAARNQSHHVGRGPHRRNSRGADALEVLHVAMEGNKNKKTGTGIRRGRTQM